MEHKLRERRTELFSFLVLSLVPVKISYQGRSMMLSFKDNPLPSHVMHYPVLFTQLKNSTMKYVLYTTIYCSIMNVYVFDVYFR